MDGGRYKLRGGLKMHVGGIVREMQPRRSRIGER